MAKKRVYVETSVISYLTARPSSKPISRLRQQITAVWWEYRNRWELFISPTVNWEMQRGDRDAAQKRVEAAIGLPLLVETEEVRALAFRLFADDFFPEKAYADAFHVANTAVHGMDYLVTWNKTHLLNEKNVKKLEKLYETIRKQGYKPAELIRPDTLLEKKDGP